MPGTTANPGEDDDGDDDGGSGGEKCSSVEGRPVIQEAGKGTAELGLLGKGAEAPSRGRVQHSGHSEGKEKDVPRMFSQPGTALNS